MRSPTLYRESAQTRRWLGDLAQRCADQAFAEGGPRQRAGYVWQREARAWHRLADADERTADERGEPPLDESHTTPLEA